MKNSANFLSVSILGFFFFFAIWEIVFKNVLWKIGLMKWHQNMFNRWLWMSNVSIFWSLDITSYYILTINLCYK